MPTFKISKYWKGVIATLVPVAQLAYAVSTDGQITGEEGITFLIALAGAIGVIMKSNRTDPNIPAPTSSDPRKH